ncbi:MAG: Asp-tRNA(Asn)/Glu-tRNA(Gln) amidotransferase subunit GatC [Candidatus Sumerlaeota bacterium]|nr:Asp-tRNA(Asn)/Glu-tRNA(Gln) amidotransferase subunit GatC [Candidatus Sumerlaeota bacterium]
MSASEILISEDDVRHVALLSRLEFDAERLKHYTRDLNAILGYIEQLKELDTSGVEPTSHAIKQVNVLREDAARASLTNEEALANAPESEAGYFKVPKIIQEE